MEQIENGKALKDFNLEVSNPDLFNYKKGLLSQ